MDFGDFDTCFDELRIVLRDRLGNGENAQKLDIYGSYLSYGDEIKIIIDRIETETQKSVTLSKKLFETLQKDEEPDEEFGTELIRNLMLITLDIKSFFIFTRIFLDTLAWIIKQYYGKNGDQLSSDMRKLVKNTKFDDDFAKELKSKMQWVEDFVKTRVEIEHYLGSIRSTTTKNGKFGFDILSSNIRHDWGTDTVESITDYIGETLHNLSEAISCIHNKIQSENIST